MTTPSRSTIATRTSTAIVLTLTLLAALAGTMPRPAPAQEEPERQTGRLLVTIVDESGVARGGACVLVVDAAGGEWKLCDEDGDGTLVGDGLPAGKTKVMPHQAAGGCAGRFGGDVEIPASGEAGLTLTDACEPLPPAAEEKPTEAPTPAEKEEPTKEPRPTQEPAPTQEAKPTQEPTPTVPPTPTPTPTVAPPPPPTPTPSPPPTTGALQITLTSATYGAPSLEACFEVLDQATFATLAAGCDGDDGANDGLTAFSPLPPARIVVQQVSGDHNDNPTDARVTRIVAGKTTSVALTTLPLADLVIVPVAADGVTPLYDACFAVYRAYDGTIGRDACAGPDGRVVFSDLPAYFWWLVETIEPTVAGAGGLLQPYASDGPASVYHDVAVDTVVVATHHPRLGSLTLETIGADYGQAVAGACVQIDGLAAGPSQGCDSDLDGQIVLTGLPIGDYTVTVTGNAETLNGITYRALGPGAATWPPTVRIEAGTMDRTIQIGFVRTASFFVFAFHPGTWLPLAGACYTVYSEAANGVRTAMDQGCISPYNTFRPYGEVGLLVPGPGRYVVVQTSTPPGYTTPAEQWIQVSTSGGQAGTQGLNFYPARI